MASTATPPSVGAPLALASHARPRPTPVRRPTSQILSYYQSEAANAGSGDTSYKYEEGREEGGNTVSWAKKASGNGKRSASPTHLSDYFESDNDNDTKRASVRDSVLTEGPIEYGIAVGTPSGLLDRPGSSFFGSTGVHMRTVMGSDEPAPKPTPTSNVTVQAPALGHRRRTSARSSGGEDKRRVAVVEVDSASEAEQLSDNGTTRGQGRPSAAFVFPPSSSTNSSTSSTTRSTSSADTVGTYGSITSISSIISRRGHHKVALLLPAASPSTIAKLSYFTPPLSAPVPVLSDRPKLAPPPLLRNESTNSNLSTASVSSSVRLHKRSQSEAVLVSGRSSQSHPLNLGFEHLATPQTPPTETTTRRGHKLRASSRDIGIVGAHLHSLSPPTTADPTIDTDKMQIDVRPVEVSKPVRPSNNGRTAQHTQQLSPIFQRPSLSQTSSYVSSTESAVQPMNTSSTDQHTGTFSVFKESNRRILTQADTRAAGDTSSISSSSKADNYSNRERDERQHSNELRQQTQLATSAVSSANGHASSTATPSPSATPQAQVRDTSSQSPYLHYQPGLHATAGPLPPPPKVFHPEQPDSKKDSIGARSQTPSTTSRAVGTAPPRPPRFHTPRDAGSLPKHHTDASSRSLEAESSGSSLTSNTQPSQANPSNATVTPSTTSSTLVESHSEGSVKIKHTREGAFPITSVIVHQTQPVSHDSTSHATVKEVNDKLVAPSGTDLKRKNTMEDLVKDVTAVIDELSPGTSSSKAEPQPNHSSRPLTRERSATTIASTSETKTNSDTSSRKLAMDDRTNKPSLTSHRSAIDLRREGSKNTFKGALPPTRDGSDSDYSDSDYENITVSRVPNDPLYHVRSPGMHAPSASMSDSGHGYSPSGSLKGPHSPQSKMLDFASAIKRFSALPRAPSRLSVSRASQHSSSVGHDHITHEQYATTSTVQSVPHMEPPPRPKHYALKVQSAWPEAMRFGDVLKLKTPLERSIGYARKINELANHDPGLEDWVISTKENLTRAGTKRKSISPTASRSPAEQTSFQPRHVSRGSIGSEMTFPKRVDAYVATDLIPHEKPGEVIPRGPTIPYPTLPPAPFHHPTSVAAAASALLHPSSSTRQLPFGVRNLPGPLALSRSGTSTTNGTPPTAGNGHSGGGFFSSIGRKTSIKRDRPACTGPSLPQPNKLLSKRQQANPQPAPRPIQITASPSLPGGPRAPPGRAPPVARAQSVIAPKTVIGEVTHNGGIETDVEPVKKRRLSIKRTGSVQPPPLPARSTTLPPASINASGGVLGAEVNLDAQLTKLKDLLPNANRAILEGYLRRAGGSEMLAIGRYLDDEKNGALRVV